MTINEFKYYKLKGFKNYKINFTKAIYVTLEMWYFC
jgi:hypothetical protein